MRRPPFIPGVHVGTIRPPLPEGCEACATQGHVTTRPVHDGFNVRDRRNLWHRIVSAATPPKQRRLL